MIGEMTVTKVTVMSNDRLRKQERLGYRIDRQLSWSRGVKGRLPIDVIGQGCLRDGVTSGSECKG